MILDDPRQIARLPESRHAVQDHYRCDEGQRMDGGRILKAAAPGHGVKHSRRAHDTPGAADFQSTSN